MRSTKNVMRPILTLAVLPLAVLTLAGCFGLGRGAPVQRHYVLGLGLAPSGSQPAEALGAGSGPRIGIRALRLAQYLDTPLIVVRRGQHQIGLSEFHRWGEPLTQGVNRTVAAHLAALRPDLLVEFAPWASRARHDWVIQLQILSFGGSVPDDVTATTGEARVLATWEIARGDDGAVVARGTTEYRGEGWKVGDYDALLGLLETGLSKLADDLVAALASLGAP
jgi:hypothetical protein